MAFRSALPAETPRSKEPVFGSGGPATSKRSKTSSHQNFIGENGEKKNNCWNPLKGDPINTHVIYKIVLMGVDHGYHPWKFMWIQMKILDHAHETPWFHFAVINVKFSFSVFPRQEKKAHFVDLPRLDNQMETDFSSPGKRELGGTPSFHAPIFSVHPMPMVFSPEVWGMEYTQNKPQKIQLKDLF